ncbi:MAG: ATP-binding cassette domain-containing protein [Bacteroidales bacterium]|nr:ATP-binding cassette domain-containing protein [Bacteroidales bacterium]
MSLISCQHISKKFGPKTALDDVSLEVPRGQIFGLLGPNGAGKTTLIRIINRILVQNEGIVLFDGRPITREDVARIGYLPEERGLYRKMKVGDQAMYLAQLKGMSASDAAAELKKWFQKFGISSWWNKKVEELSKGMAQKVQFITTVVHRPSLLILDEPFSGFDPVNAQLIRDEILALKEQGATILLSTHNMESVEQLCDNIALINKSRLVISGSVDAIRRDYGQHRRSVEYTGAPLKSVPAVFDLVSDEEGEDHRVALLAPAPGADNASVLTALLEQGANILSFSETTARMNDIFISLVQS